MSVNIKQNGELIKIANNVSIVQADWNDRENTDKKSCIKNQPETIKTMADLIACQDNNALAGAMAVVEALDYQNVARDMDGEYSTLEEFVEATNTYSGIPRIGRCHDISSTGWTNGAEPFSEGNQWYRYIIIYSASYKAGNTNDIHGNGIFWHRSRKMYNVLITGNKDTGLTLTYEVLNKPTIKTKNDLMANTVSGLFPDALAVKDAVNYINVAQKNQAKFATLEEFVSATCLNNGEIPHIFRFGDTGGWGPLAGASWYRCMIQYQNWYQSGNTYSVTGQGVLWADDGTTYIMNISGNKDTGLSVKYSIIGSISTREEIINANQLSYSFNDAASNGGLSANDITFLSMHIYHFDGHRHGINLGLQFNKKIPAGSKITITVSGTTIDHTLTPNWNNVQWGNMAMLRENNQILLIATKEISSGYGWWSYIPFNTFYAYNK